VRRFQDPLRRSPAPGVRTRIERLLEEEQHRPDSDYPPQAPSKGRRV
jgi:hypothetical protein